MLQTAGPTPNAPTGRPGAIQSQEQFTVTIDLNFGRGRADGYICDCSEDYVRINVYYVRDMTGRTPT